MGRMALLWYGQWIFWFVVMFGIYFWHKKTHSEKKNERGNEKWTA